MVKVYSFIGFQHRFQMAMDRYATTPALILPLDQKPFLTSPLFQADDGKETV